MSAVFSTNEPERGWTPADTERFRRWLDELDWAVRVADGRRSGVRLVSTRFDAAPRHGRVVCVGGQAWRRLRPSTPHTTAVRWL